MVQKIHHSVSQPIHYRALSEMPAHHPPCASSAEHDGSGARSDEDSAGWLRSVWYVDRDSKRAKKAGGAAGGSWNRNEPRARQKRQGATWFLDDLLDGKEPRGRCCRFGDPLTAEWVVNRADDSCRAAQHGKQEGRGREKKSQR